MKTFRECLGRFLSSENAEIKVQYVVVIALIAVAILYSLPKLGNACNTRNNSTATWLGQVGSGS